MPANPVSATMVRRWAALLCLAGGLLLGGCAAFDGYPRRVTEPDADIAELKDQLGATAIRDCLKAPDLGCRNRIIGARMYATDIRFSQFEEALFRDTRRGGFNATLATLGLSTAAAASTGGAAQALSGLSALIIGGREAFQKEVLSERTVIAIHTAMRARRAQVALRLRGALEEPIARYPLEAALADLDAYYNAGTVLGALVSITETVGARAEEAEAELRDQLSFRLDAEATKLGLLVCGSDKDCKAPNVAELQRAKACWPQVGVPETTLMLDFVLQPRFARERGLVARCLGL
jgi:hypothetical protein